MTKLPENVKNAGVYVISDGSFIKIGMTGNAKNRKGDYAKHGPNGFYWFFVPCKNKKEARQLENTLQGLLIVNGLQKHNGREWMDAGDTAGVAQKAQDTKTAAQRLGYMTVDVCAKNIDLI